MHRGGIQRIVTVHDAQEAGRLLERLVAQARHLEQILAGAEGAMLVAVSDDDWPPCAGPETRNARAAAARRRYSHPRRPR